jgi:DNA-directed RNA polymerase subunit RPC12/RpoP
MSEDEYVCTACGETFPTEAALRRHVRTVGLVE